MTAGFVAAVEAGADGAFELGGLEGKAYRLVIMKQATRRSEVPVTLETGGRVDVGAVALEAGKAVSGVVVDDQGQPWLASRSTRPTPAPGASPPPPPWGRSADPTGPSWSRAWPRSSST